MFYKPQITCRNVLKDMMKVKIHVGKKVKETFWGNFLSKSLYDSQRILNQIFSNVGTVLECGWGISYCFGKFKISVKIFYKPQITFRNVLRPIVKDKIDVGKKV